MNQTTPLSIQKLQKALHDKAKESPDFRCYALYDKVYRKDVLAFAYERCKAKGGAAGVDGQTLEDIEEYGVERWLDEWAQAYRAVHTRKRLRPWLCAQHQVSWPATRQFPVADRHDGWGLVRLTTRTHSLPWANS
jgi:hypothetical protein